MTPNKVMCKEFPTKLKEAIRVWFNKIALGTIENFEQLSKGFVHHFIGGKDTRSQSVIFSTFNKQKENH